MNRKVLNRSPNVTISFKLLIAILASNQVSGYWYDHVDRPYPKEKKEIFIVADWLKRNLVSSITNLVYDLPHKLPNDLRELRNIRKFQIFVKTWPSAQSPFHKLNFGNSSQKYAEVDFKLFCSQSILLDFSALFQIFCRGL